MKEKETSSGPSYECLMSVSSNLRANRVIKWMAILISVVKIIKIMPCLMKCGKDGQSIRQRKSTSSGKGTRDKIVAVHGRRHEQVFDSWEANSSKESKKSSPKGKFPPKLVCWPLLYGRGCLKDRTAASKARSQEEGRQDFKMKVNKKVTVQKLT